MKKIITSIAFALITLCAFSQSRLGSSASEIKSEFWESSYNLSSGYSKNGTYYISIQTERATANYLFDDEGICNICMIIPDNQGALNFYVELYNTKYVIVSSTKWKMYSNNGIANIELIYPEDGGYYFVWY